MRFGGSVAALLVLSVWLSGCSDSGGRPEDASDTSDTSTDASPTRTNRPPPTTSGNPPNPPGGGQNNSTEPPRTYPPWPNLNDAQIRPGVRVASDVGSCTSNFLFRTPNNTTLYLGLAAHCVNGMKLGDDVAIQEIEGGSTPGTLAYSSWLALGLEPCDGALSCGGQYDHDFALIAIDPDARSKVHPATQFFGGPTQLVNARDLAVGQRVLVYGNSPDWFGFQPAKTHEGVVTGRQTDASAQFFIASLLPGIPGDSGSAVLTKDGRAAGVLVSICLTPCAAQNGVVGLQGALDLLGELTELEVELVTWEQLDDGPLP